MTNFNLCAAALSATIVMGAGTAQAATYAASQIVEEQTSYGICSKPSRKECKKNHLKVESALGEADGEYYALGLGGYLTLAFDLPKMAAGSTVTIYENTLKRPDVGGFHYEAVDIYSVFKGVTTFVDTVYNTASSTTFRIAQSFEYLSFIDVTLREFTKTSSFNGFDIDSVIVDTNTATIAPVPLPAGGGLLLAGLGILGWVRTRKAAV